MAKFTVGHGLDDYIKDLEDVQMLSSKLIGRAIYYGADVMANEIRKQIQSLPVQKEPAKRGHRRNPSQVEIDGMLEGLGIAKKRVVNGFTNVKIGIDGYNKHVTEDYPKGHPNAMVARSILIGTTFMNRHPFVDRAVNVCISRVEQKMKETIEDGINQEMQ